MGAPAALSTEGLVIAHRAANSRAGLAAAAGSADVVEADVHLFRGRLEVRHAKTLGPFPRLWERWYLLDRDAPRPPLEEILPAVDPGVGLLLDLKGPDPRLPRAVLRAARERIAGPGLFVSGRVWRSIEALRGVPGVGTLLSVGGPHGLRRLLRRYGPDDLEGVTVHRELLTPSVAEALRRRAPAVWTWPVDDPETARTLAAWGVTGFISDAPGRLPRRVTA
jgi:glycerophosphoryl diester phosphodiesterase